MQRIKRTIMVALAIPVLYGGSCLPFSDTLLRTLRDASFDGAAQYVQSETFNLLNNNVGGIGG